MKRSPLPINETDSITATILLHDMSASSFVAIQTKKYRLFSAITLLKGPTGTDMPG